MTHRVGAKGQVVIPKEMRKRAGLRPGSEVDFELDASGSCSWLGGSRPARVAGSPAAAWRSGCWPTARAIG